MTTKEQQLTDEIEKINRDSIEYKIGLLEGKIYFLEYLYQHIHIASEIIQDSLPKLKQQLQELKNKENAQ